MSGVKYCVCSSKHCLRQQDGWEPYVERKDILVWRKEHQCKKGLYHYKLYGKFDDVNVWEFLAVQLDLSKYKAGLGHHHLAVQGGGHPDTDQLCSR